MVLRVQPKIINVLVLKRNEAGIEYKREFTKNNLHMCVPSSVQFVVTVDARILQSTDKSKVKPLCSGASIKTILWSQIT